MVAGSIFSSWFFLFVSLLRCQHSSSQPKKRKIFPFFHSLVLGPLHFTSPVKLYHVWIVNSSSESENNDQNSLLPPSENFARSAALLDLLYKVYSAHERTDTRGREGGASSGTWGSRVADPALFLTLYCATSYITTCSSTTTMKSGPKKNHNCIILQILSTIFIKKAFSVLEQE